MRLSRMIFLLACLVAGIAQAQSWREAYDLGLKALNAQKYGEAREAFKKAVSLRAEDMSGPTRLPGSVTDQKIWRNGAPYSANFGAAYAGYRIAISMQDTPERSDALKGIAVEFETLLNKSQNSPETFYFLNAIYDATRNLEAQQKLGDKFAQLNGLLTWKVDQEILLPEEKSAIAATSKGGPSKGNPLGGTGTGNVTTVPTNAGTAPTLSGKVPVVANKFALLIGNSEGKLVDGMIPFATNDAMFVREGLVQNGGYAEQNIDMVINATTSQMRTSAKALADRIPDGSTVFLYFAGAGANLDGKDYLAGIDTEMSTDSSSMVAKADILKMFMAKGAKVFCFFEVNRPIVAGRYFGMEIPMVGMVSQVQSTLPGESVLGIMKSGQMVGVFAEGIVSVLKELRSNRVPILDFGWQVFYHMRKGDTGSNAGGSLQTPTLPVLTNLASDARF